jgi:membrane associated rhomboid family serine protease
MVSLFYTYRIILCVFVLCQHSQVAEASSRWPSIKSKVPLRYIGKRVEEKSSRRISILLRGGATDKILEDIGDHFQKLLNGGQRIINRLKPQVLDMISTSENNFLSYPTPIRALLVINIAVFITWQIFPEFMFKNFTESKNNLQKSRYWTCITQAFSHSNLLHLISNMLCLTSIGTAVASSLQPHVFYSLVGFSALLSGIFSTISRKFSLIFWPANRRKLRSNKITLGFSGVNTALLFIYTILYPNVQLSILNSDPMPSEIALKRLIAIG